MQSLFFCVLMLYDKLSCHVLYDTSIGIRCPINDALFNKCRHQGCTKYALIDKVCIWIILLSI